MIEVVGVLQLRNQPPEIQVVRRLLQRLSPTGESVSLVPAAPNNLGKCSILFETGTQWGLVRRICHRMTGTEPVPSFALPVWENIGVAFFVTARF